MADWTHGGSCVMIVAMPHAVFITGATGYLGRPLAEELIRHGHQVKALVRPGSESKAPEGAEIVSGDPLERASFQDKIAPCDTLVQLVGVAHPGPGKKQQFLSIDLVSVQQSVAAARDAGVRHFVYLSVAHPAPVMKDYIAVRQEGERLIREAGFAATILRPWYVLGPGHWWPVLFVPGYWIAQLVPAWRDGARRLGLVTFSQMLRALVDAVEHPPVDGEQRIRGVPEIRATPSG